MQDKIKILYVSNMTDYSGGEIVLERLILNNPGVEVSVALPHGKFATRLLTNNVKVLFVNSLKPLNRRNNKLYFFNFIFQLVKISLTLAKIIQKHNITIVVANGAGVALYSALASKISNIKSVWIHHHPILQPSTIEYKIAPLLVRLTSKVVCVSNAVRNSFIQSGSNKEKLLTIHNGLDVNEFNDMNYQVGFLRNNYSIATHTVLIGILATITEWKGHQTLVSAIGYLKTSGLPPESFKCFIIGDVLNSNSADVQFYSSLQKEVAMHGLSQEIIFTGRINATKEVYKDLDIVLNCSTQPEPLGTTIYEGMAMQKVVIATNVGGSSEIIDHGINGFLIEPANPILLGSQLKELINYPSYCREIGIKARQKVLQDFNIKVAVEKYNQLFDEVIRN